MKITLSIERRGWVTQVFSITGSELFYGSILFIGAASLGVLMAWRV